MRSARGDVEILRWAHGGDGVAVAAEGPGAGKILFVPGVVPGDVATVEIVEEKRRWARGKVVRLVRPSPRRVAVPCAVQPRCGGCPWMPGSTEAQAEARRAILVGELQKRLGLTEEELDAPIAMPEAPRRFGYRQRLRLSFAAHGEDVRVGFVARRSHRLIDVERCEVADPAINAVLPRLRRFIAERSVGRRIEGQVTLVAGADGVSGWVETKAGHQGVPFGPESVNLMIGGHALAVSARVFVQANGGVTEQLIATLDRWAEHARADQPGDPWAVELYAGSGMLTLALWSAGWRVAAYELDPTSRTGFEATRKAVGIELSRGDWHACDLSLGVPLPAPPAKPAMVVLDPPRTGAAAVMPWVRGSGARDVVYVSCDLATGLRDLASLTADGAYRVAEIVALDMFPHTGHQEVLFRLQAMSKSNSSASSRPRIRKPSGDA